MCRGEIGERETTDGGDRLDINNLTLFSRLGEKECGDALPLIGGGDSESEDDSDRAAVA